MLGFHAARAAGLSRSNPEPWIHPIYSPCVLLPSLDDINFLVTPPAILAPGRVSTEPTRGSNEKGNPSMGWILVWLAYEGRCANQT